MSCLMSSFFPTSHSPCVYLCVCVSPVVFIFVALLLAMRLMLSRLSRRDSYATTDGLEGG